MAVRSTDEVRSLRDQIFMMEQTRWVTPGVSVLKTKSRETVRSSRSSRPWPVCRAPGIYNRGAQLILPHDLAEWGPHCAFGSKARIEALVAAYLKAVKAKLPATTEARNLYDALVRPIPEAPQKQSLIIVATASCISCRSTGSETYPAAMWRKPERSSIHLPQPHFTC